ncbi:MAG: Lrp/AsnC family transcriptional regulator [Alphaproteobacteria bacterium]|jgi:DNA-binding Lrp family transcriptional regulator|nr:Lrp/AsnC family transcriptional regulator [Alphaproteobacteria bacterium]MDP6873080.1 Lrp/AsnC family transcriptional regulator [Alphaproteobacteria bacterium]
MQESLTLDAMDLKILDALQRDATISNQDLAAEVGLSPSQCSRRRTGLEKSGVINGYHAVLDRERLGFGVTVFVSVSLNAHNVKGALGIRELAAVTPEILEAHALTGSADYLLKVSVRDLRALSALVNDVLLPNEGVARVHSNIVLETLKEGTRLALTPGPVRPRRRAD